MIAIAFALPDESKKLVPLLAHASVAGKTLAGPIHRGELAGQPVIVCHTGIGSEAARETLGRILKEFGPEMVISAGFAGALSPALRVGSLVCDLRGHQLQLGPDEAPWHLGKIHTAGQTIEGPLDKARLFSETGALAVDMETGAIAAACLATGARVIALRAISDAAEEGLLMPMDVWFDLSRQRPRILGLLAHLATHPGKIRPFTRFVRALAAPRAALAHALPLLITRLVTHG